MLTIYKNLQILLTISVCLIYSVAYTEMHINITEGIHNPHLIGIIPFHNNNKIALHDNNIANIISDDLCNSGKFRSLPPSQFPENINNINNISIQEWLKLGVNILIIGNINEISNKEYLISYQLIDISTHSKKIILQNQYTVTYQWIRYGAHNISNDIFEKLTGIKGAFCTRIAYIIHTNNDEQYPYKLYVADYDGHNSILIQHSQEPLMSPAWAPSGNYLVYVMFTKKRAMLVIHDLKNGLVRQLVNFPQHNGAPAFSPDGKKLAFVSSKTGSLNLYVLDLATNKIQQITNERNNNTEPSWFPDNKTIAYTSDRSGNPQIYQIDINDGKNLSQRLSWLNCHNQNGHISSDGSFLVMISRNNNSQNITRLNLLTGKHYKLTNDILNESLTLSPNDNMLIYNTSEGSESKLCLLSLNSCYKMCFQMYHNKNIRFPAWSSYIE